MLKKILTLEGVEKLNKHQQSLLIGGNLTHNGDDQAEYQCCWEGTNNCSECVVTPTPRCSSGAVARQC